MAFVRTHSNLYTLLTRSPAGSGKTVLCSTVIEIIQDVCKSFPDCRMAYFYFDFHDYEKQKMESLLRSLLRQLVAHEQNVPQPIVGLCKTLKDKGQSPSLKDLESALSLVLRQSLKDTYIVIDALDEFPDWTAFEKREELLRILTKIVVDHPSNLHVLASSRDEIDIRRAIEGIPHCEVCLGTFGIDIDIRSYVQTTLADPLERLSTFPDSLKSEIEMAVCQGAHGM
jgi:ATP/maltotriose-dependent transcriptional regulator MalT